MTTNPLAYQLAVAAGLRADGDGAAADAVLALSPQEVADILLGTTPPEPAVETFAWRPYRGPEGGQGWQSDTGEIRYQQEQPDASEGGAARDVNDGTGGGSDPWRQDVMPAVDKASRVIGGAMVGGLTGSALAGPLGLAVGTVAGGALGTDTARSILGGIRDLLHRGEEPEAARSQLRDVARRATAGEPEATQAVRADATDQVRAAAGELAKLPPGDPAEVRGGWAQASARMRAGDAAEIGGHVESLATARTPGAIETAFRGIGGVLGRLTGGALRAAFGAIKAFGRWATTSGRPYMVWAAALATGAAVLFSPAVAIGLELIPWQAAFMLAPVATAGAIGVGMVGRSAQARAGKYAVPERFAEWQPYTGPEGGRGWSNGTEVRYQVEMPGGGTDRTSAIDRADIGDDDPVELYTTDGGEVFWTGSHAEAKQFIQEVIREDGAAALDRVVLRRPGEALRVQQPVAPKAKPADQPASVSLPPPSDYKAFRPGEPIEATVYRGEAAGGSGSGMAALGHGRYFGLEPAVAVRFSKPGTVRADTIRLSRPAVVRNDAEMVALKKQAEAATGLDFGRAGNNYIGFLYGDQPVAFTRALQAMGYDGIATTYKEAPGGEQVVVFPPQSFAEWRPYQGPEGGRGWQSDTGEVRYQDAKPDGGGGGQPPKAAAPGEPGAKPDQIENKDKPPKPDATGRGPGGNRAKADPTDWQTPDWQHSPTDRSQTRYVNRYTGKVVYAKEPPKGRTEQQRKAAVETRAARLLEPAKIDPAYVTGAAEATAAVGLTPEAVPALMGGQNGTTVKVTKSLYGNGLYLSLDHPDTTTWSRTVTAQPDGSLEVYNAMFFLRPNAQGDGFGTKAFAGQVAAAVDHGVARIRTTAGRGTLDGVPMNGYATWPRLGYDAPLTDGQRRRLPPGLKGAKTVLDLYDSKEGRDWWKANGETTSMTFDVSPGSKSMAVLNAYLSSKGQPTIGYTAEQAAANKARQADRVAAVKKKGDEELARLRQANLDFAHDRGQVSAHQAGFDHQEIRRAAEANVARVYDPHGTMLGSERLRMSYTFTLNEAGRQRLAERLDSEDGRATAARYDEYARQSGIDPAAVHAEARRIGATDSGILNSTDARYVVRQVYLKAFENLGGNRAAT
jgi:hypothetical protein